MSNHLHSISSDFYNYLNNAKKKYLYSFNSSKYSTNFFPIEPSIYIIGKKELTNNKKEMKDMYGNFSNSILSKSLEIGKCKVQKLQRKAENVYIIIGFKIIKKFKS